MIRSGALLVFVSVSLSASRLTATQLKEETGMKKAGMGNSSIRFCLSLVLTLLAFSFGAMASSAGTFNASGLWNSEFGPVNLNVYRVHSDGSQEVNGYWDQAPGKRGTITKGRFMPKTGMLKFKYYQSWNSVQGSAVFYLNQNHTVLDGTYTQPGKSGKWTLTRPSVGFNQGNSWPGGGKPWKKNQPVYRNINGSWNSNFGPVQIQCTRSGHVSGYWDQSQGKRGLIQTGSFDPGTGSLWIDYYMPWKNLKGHANFTLNRSGSVLAGSYQQADGSGNWTLSR